MQKLCLKDLTVEENYIKGFARLSYAITVNLEKNYKEVDRIINALYCRERRV